MPFWQIIIIVILSAFMLLALGVVIYARHFVVKYFSRVNPDKKPKRKKKKRSAEDEEYRRFMLDARESLEKMQFESLEITSKDGLILRGKLYRPNEPTDKAVICVHGYRGAGTKDMAAIVPFFLEIGFNVLTVDNRAHGDSEGSIIGFGITDRFDVLGWVDKITEVLSPTAVFLYGVSMGASSVIMAGEFVPSVVKGIIADCGFTTPYEQFSYLFRSVAHFPPCFIMPFLRSYAKRYAGFDIKSVDTRTVLSKIDLPVLLIHGGKDRFVPPYMSEQNAAAAKNSRLLILKSAKHAKSHYTAREEYEQAVSDFIEKTL